MKTRGSMAGLALLLLLVPACRKPDTVVVDQTRIVTMADENLKLDATSDERFQEPGSNPIIASLVPGDWIPGQTSEFRLLSYRFGTGGEVAVGISQGGVMPNANRWLGQFGAPMLDEAKLPALERVEVLGVSGYWIEAEGDFSPGMDMPKRTDQAVAGVIADDGGRIVTVKMTGPAADVAAQKDALRAFIKALRYR